MQKTAMIAVEDTSLQHIVAAECANLGLMIERAACDPFAIMTLIDPVPPDILVLDVGAAGGDDLPLCRTLRADRKLSNLPVVVLIPLASGEAAAQCQELRMHGVECGPDAPHHLASLL